MNIKIFTQFILSALLSVSLFATALAQNAFYTEDFAGGFPSDWTSVEVVGNGTPSSVWVHTTTGPAGGFATAPIASTTAANGWMIFDSDLNCNHPTGQDAWLISPEVDASSQTEVWLQFETYFRSFNDRPQVRIGTDLGDLTTWDVIEVFPGITANEFGGIIVGNEDLNPQIVNLNLTESAAGETFRFAFQFLSSSETANGGTLTGCGYNWQVDDVRLLDANPIAQHDLVVSRPRLAPNYGQPESQIDTVFFAALLNNLGLQDQTNVVLSVDVAGDNGDSFSSSAATDLLEVDSSATVFLDDFFIPNGDQGTYSMTYGVAADSTDQMPENNNLGLEFIVTENLFSKDNGFADFSTAPAAIDGETWQVGNYYFVPNGGFEAYEASFSVASDNNAHQGQSANVFLYKMVEGYVPDAFTDEDVELLGFNTYNFTDEVNGDLVSIEILSLEDNQPGVELEEQTEYLLMIEYTTDMRGIFSDLPADYDVATVVEDGGWFLGGFTGDAIVFARMRIRSVESSIGEVEIAKAEIDLFPNPATEAIRATIELEQVSSQMQVRILNLNGQALLAQTFDNTVKEIAEFDVRSLPAGTYFLQIQVDDGLKTKKFTVQR